MGRIIAFIISTTLLVCVSVRPVHAEPVLRDILALVDGTEIKYEYDNNIHRLAEMPLNFLGFKLTYLDISTTPLPSDEEMQKYRGIISWFKDDNIKGAADYIKWLTRQVRNGKLYVMLDDFGFTRDGLAYTSKELQDDFFSAFEVNYDPEFWTNSPLTIKIAKNDPAMTEFERGLADELTYFDKIDVLDKNAEIYLKLQRVDDNNIFCDVVFAHSKGGAVMQTYAYYENPYDFQTRWRIDPFKYFARAFKADFPSPDVTTINGMRTFYSHIDGDGIRNISLIDRKTTSGEIIYRDILAKMELPVTVSVLVGDILQAGNKEAKYLKGLIKKILALANVDLASHGWAHPLIWKIEKRKMAFKFSGYRYSPESEIGKSIEYINKNLAPAGKKTNLFFWTGDCEPDLDALKYVTENKINALNGGDTRLDNQYPSYSYVTALFRHVDQYLQYYASDSNEVPYTNIWTGPFYGFKEVTETYKRTESPIRLKPIDIYYHFYAAERKVAYDTIRDAYTWAETQEIAPVFAIDYIHLVDGFLTAQIEKIGDRAWRINNYEHLKTYRIDNSNDYVDLTRSKNVLGFMHYQGSLYVHVGNGDSAEIYLTKTPPARPYLAKANGRSASFKVNGGNSEFSIQTMGKIHFSVGGLGRGSSYTVLLRSDDFGLKNFAPWFMVPVGIGQLKFESKSDDKGFLNFKEDVLKNRFETVTVEIVKT